MFKKSAMLILLGVFCVLLIAETASVHQLDPFNPEYVPNEILVKFSDDVSVNVNYEKGVVSIGKNTTDAILAKWKASEIQKVFTSESKRGEKKYIRTPGGITKEVPQLFNIYKIRVPHNTDIEPLITELQQDDNIEFAEPNYYFYTMVTNPNDPLYNNQNYLGDVNANRAWDTTTGSSSQIIAIIDTGVDWTHPDLDDNIWDNSDEIPNNGIDDDGNGFIDDVRGWDFVNLDNNPRDDNSHGTHVAGIAAAEADNSTGISGVAWNSKIMPIKVLQSSGYGSSSDIAAGIDYAAENGAEIINLSLGSYGESLTLKIALENAYACATIVAAAVNDGYKIDPPF
ncbi:MAG: S8 family serine peptidase, partial [Candidatus Cloacimonetes bacterium]|nr:S8 family serine peptidase [Candidatus Cloacimonadota bacterium]